MLNNKLFFRIALLFLLILAGVAIVVSWISFETAQKYYDEANQKLNAKLAQFTADHVNSFTEDGSIDTLATSDIMHSMMVINPDVEVYLLDQDGQIVSHVAPYKKVVRKKVNLDPIKKFIQTKGEVCVMGDDPRDFEGSKVFSAAPVMQNDELKGYYYIILASQERAGVLNSMKSTFALGVGMRLIMFTILISLLLGLAVLYYQVRQLGPLTSTMQAFQNGNYNARVPGSGGQFGLLTNTFNAMASQIEQHVDKIKSVNGFRKELVANISHDLRTPLSIILGYTETLQIKRETLSNEQKSTYINNIAESSKRLKGLVNQLFELSNLENNQIEIHNEPFSLSELVKDLIGRYEVLAAEKSIAVDYKIIENLPFAYGDIAQVERVIQNLLDNALKFTPKNGKIVLDIRQDGEHLIFNISDTGIGIPEENLSAVFNRYERSKEGDKKGTGLGLAIANKIMELHNSKILVSSKVNEGTTFSFNLPIYTL